MRNIVLVIEYRGTAYKGWQRQKRDRSIQETIERVLTRILGHRVHLIGAGRTDTGVHALGQVANFKTSHTVPREKLQESLNALLPEDIAVVRVEEAGPDFHSRFCARGKVYRYTILNRRHRSAFLGDRALFCRYPLDVALMRKEARVLLGKHSFKAFTGAGAKKMNHVRTIRKLSLTRRQEVIEIEIEGDGFLYTMVRTIVGTLIEIGRGKLPRGSVARILRSQDRTQAGPTAPACGLCLREVKY